MSDIRGAFFWDGLLLLLLLLLLFIGILWYIFFKKHLILQVNSYHGCRV